MESTSSLIEELWEYMDLRDQIRVKLMFPTNDKLQFGDSHVWDLPVKKGDYTVFARLAKALETRQIVTDNTTTDDHMRVICLYCVLTDKTLFAGKYYWNVYARNTGIRHRNISGYSSVPLDWDYDALVVLNDYSFYYNHSSAHAKSLHEMVRAGVPVIILGNRHHKLISGRVDPDEFRSCLEIITGVYSRNEEVVYECISKYLNQIGEVTIHRNKKGEYDYSNALLELTRLDFQESVH